MSRKRLNIQKYPPAIPIDIYLEKGTLTVNIKDEFEYFFNQCMSIKKQNNKEGFYDLSCKMMIHNTGHYIYVPRKMPLIAVSGFKPLSLGYEQHDILYALFNKRKTDMLRNSGISIPGVCKVAPDLMECATWPTKTGEKCYYENNIRTTISHLQRKFRSYFHNELITNIKNYGYYVNCNPYIVILD